MTIQDHNQLYDAGQSIIPSLPPYDASKLKSCHHPIFASGLPSYCHSRFCLLCSRLAAERESRNLAHRLRTVHTEDRRRQLLFATFTQQSCHTAEIRTAAQAATAAWNRLLRNRLLRNNDTRHIIGAYRWLEIKADDTQPGLENVHIHAAMVTAPGYSGRYRLNREEWVDLWAESVGSSLYRSAHVEAVRDIGAVAGYISSIGKFLNDADIAMAAPYRHIERAEQLYRLKRYQRYGVLQSGPVAQWVN